MMSAEEQREMGRLEAVNEGLRIQVSNLNGEIGRMKFKLNSAKSALESVHGVISESYGVSGWHLNGEVATWNELELDTEVAESLNLIEKV